MRFGKTSVASAWSWSIVSLVSIFVGKVDFLKLFYMKEGIGCFFLYLVARLATTGLG